MVLIKANSKILIIRLSAIGDVINTLPVISVLRSNFPNAYISWVVEDKAKDIVIGHPNLNEVFVYERKKWVKELWNPFTFLKVLREIVVYIKRIRSRRFDIAIDFQANLKGGVHSLLSNAKLRIGFGKSDSKEFNHLFSHIKVNLSEKRINRVLKNLSILTACGICPIKEVTFGLNITDEIETKVNLFLKNNNYESIDFVVIHPGTSLRGIAKRWPLEKYAMLADAIIEEFKLKILITWGPGEYPLANSICSNMKNNAIVSFETKSLKELAGIINKSKLFIGSDSGPLHLASALNIPNIALFGPKDPLIYGPFNPKHKIVYKENMDLITIDDVLKAIKEII